MRYIGSVSPRPPTSRDNKRYLDKKNKKQREEHKKEDNVRMRTLVGAAQGPRLELGARACGR